MKMIRRTVFFTVVAVITVEIESVQSTTLQDLDIEDLLQSVQHQIREEESMRSLLRGDDRIDEDDISTLIDELDGKKKKLNDEDYVDEELTHKLLKKIFHFTNQKKQYKPPVKRLGKGQLIPNNLLGTESILEQLNNRQKEDDTDDYSKVYLILNSDALKKSNNRGKLDELLLNLEDSLSSRKDRRPKRNKMLYKGFVINDIERRANRDSSEVYAPNSNEYRPKRQRDYNGGGGGGRTAIPYIRHRGDIYERE